MGNGNTFTPKRRICIHVKFFILKAHKPKHNFQIPVNQYDSKANSINENDTIMKGEYWITLICMFYVEYWGYFCNLITF